MRSPLVCNGLWGAATQRGMQVFNFGRFGFIPLHATPRVKNFDFRLGLQPLRLASGTVHFGRLCTPNAFHLEAAPPNIYSGFATCLQCFTH